MAEENEEESKPVEAAPKKGKTLLIVGIVAVVVLIGGAAGAFFMMKGSAKTTEELEADAAKAKDEHLKVEGSDDEEEITEGEELLGAIYPLDSFVVNLSGGGYIRVQLQLEFATMDVPKRFFNQLVPLRDGVIAILAAHTAAELKEPKGKDTLKNEVKDLVNVMMKKEDVKTVYFTQFLIQ